MEGQIFAYPVKARVRRVANIRVYTSDGTTLLYAHWDSVGRRDPTHMYMSFHMKFAAEKLGYPSRNIPLDRIDTHLNPAGGACAMKLAGFDDGSIRTFGR